MAVVYGSPTVTLSPAQVAPVATTTQISQLIPTLAPPAPAAFPTFASTVTTPPTIKQVTYSTGGAFGNTPVTTSTTTSPLGVSSTTYPGLTSPEIATSGIPLSLLPLLFGAQPQ